MYALSIPTAVTSTRSPCSSTECGCCSCHGQHLPAATDRDTCSRVTSTCASCHPAPVITRTHPHLKIHARQELCPIQHINANSLQRQVLANSAFSPLVGSREVSRQTTVPSAAIKTRVGRSMTPLPSQLPYVLLSNKQLMHLDRFAAA